MWPKPSPPPSPRHLIPGATFEHAPGFLLIRPTPLLEKERDPGLDSPPKFVLLMPLFLIYAYPLDFNCIIYLFRSKNMFQQIAFDPGILGGKLHIKGTRLSVEFLLELFASGATRDEILKSYPQLKPEAIEEALRYAAGAVKNEILIDAKI
jgi:uncharacterized protein (DUF433 family)